MRKPQAPRPSRPAEPDGQDQVRHEAVTQEVRRQPHGQAPAGQPRPEASSDRTRGSQGRGPTDRGREQAEDPGAGSQAPGSGASPAETGAELETRGDHTRRAHLAAFSSRRSQATVGQGRTEHSGRDGVVSSGLTDRLAERKRAGRSLLLRRVALWLAGVSVVLLATWAVGFSPLLALRVSDIQVSGSDGTVSADQVRQVLANRADTSLVRLDLEAMGQEVASSLVRVRSARVTRSWPHGVTVELSMRVPVAARTTDAGVEVLDRDAVVLETVPQAPSGLVAVTAPEGGTEQALSAAQVAAVAQVVGSLEESVRSQVVSGQASESGQVTLLLTSGALVRWGDTGDSELKARVLTVLMSQAHSVYDVSSPNNPTTS